MRLRTLSIKGFKSFANETTLNFSEDVIGVVGPNGSGKSNVVDAVRWVLGEQKSKDLRLEKMTDVIFNGTKKRRESPTAQVTLTFDNNKGVLPSEYSQVAISRVLYRSGESEYRLNDVKCRLKDINSLLMDTGMGSNSYAIIALGMVDDILSDKDHARRHMFEQAAGISKYKQRKKETKNKLKATVADLDRVEDLIYEIEGNLKSLEKQARRAKKYLEIKDKYKEGSIQLATHSIKALKEDYKSIEEKIGVEVAAYNQMDADLNKEEAALAKLKSDNVDTEVNLSTSQKVLNTLVSQLRELETAKELLEQKVNFKDQGRKGIIHAVERNEGLIKEIEKAIQTDTDRIEAEKRRLIDQATSIERLQSEKTAIRATYDQLKSASDEKSRFLAEQREQIFTIDKEVALAENSLHSLKESEERAERQFESKKSAFQGVEEELKKLESEAERKTREVELLKQSDEDRLSRIEHLQNNQESVQEKLQKASRTLDARKNEFALLKSMVDNLEGFPESIKYLATAWDKKPSILSDILDVDDAYKNAIELYLEPYLNYYIVENAAEAAEAIRLLTKAQKGKANFFLLDRIGKTGDRIPPFVDMITARQVVRVEKVYAALLDHLLHNVYISELDSHQIPQMDDTCTVIGTSGNYISGSYTISGGSVGLFEGKKIGRKKSLEKLSASIKEYEKEKAELESSSSQIRTEISHLKKADRKKEIASAERSIQEVRRQVIKLQHQDASYQDMMKEADARRQASKEQKEVLEERIKQKKEASVEAHAKLENMKNQDSGSKDELDLYTQKLSQATEAYNTENIAWIRQQNLVENISKDLVFNENRLADLKKQVKQGQIKIKDAETSIQALIDETTTTKERLRTLYEEKKEKEAALTTVEQSYYASRKVITESEEKVKKIARSQNQVQLKVQELRNSLTDVKFKLTSVGERINIEFGIGLNDLINEEIEEIADLEDLQKQVENLRNKLSKFGEINPMAVEAYAEMEERYHDIVKQRDDILEARASLEDTISEIEKKATAVFLESFEKVRDNFILVFRSLFSEQDDCDLILIDPESPIDSDIEIIAKPKGKKPKSLSQLSGGEKTLTATALLFSLYLLKPAPFCIFDEVDAPLDDANIQKFNKIIKKFSQDSQFIIVTHNKSTMAAVDVLYGVHMQEQGVSSVTPVDFRAFEKGEFIAAQ